MLGGCCGRRWRHRLLRWHGRRRTRLLLEEMVALHQSPLSRELWPLEIFGGELPAVRRFELNLEGHDSALDIFDFFGLASLQRICVLQEPRGRFGRLLRLCRCPFGGGSCSGLAGSRLCRCLFGGGNCSGLTGCRGRADVVDTIETLMKLLLHHLRMRHHHVCRYSFCWCCGRRRQGVTH